MLRFLDYSHIKNIDCTIKVSGSKSESNRLLILQKLFPGFQIHNLSNSDDTKNLQKALSSESYTIDIGHAGTAMRFLTSFFSIQKGREVKLTGSKRMQERPIKTLVETLQNIGADIQYLNKEGFPPLLIKGNTIQKNEVVIQGDISSQYISSLLLIAPSLKNGLKITLKGQISSLPYIEMTLKLLEKIGVNNTFQDNIIQVSNLIATNSIHNITIEPDWSSASYFYCLAALKPNSKIILPGFKKGSLQGDSTLANIYIKFGVKTSFTQDGIVIESTSYKTYPKEISFNLINTPDLAQTIAITCLGLKIPCKLTGLHTLKIKETDRLTALKNELEKLGANIRITSNSLEMNPPGKILKNTSIATYQDHRMAMAFAPLSLIVPIFIQDTRVVSKSYPDFWKDLDIIQS